MTSIEQSEDTSPAAPVREKRRRPIVAGLLSLLCPGLGQLYNAEPRRALQILGLYLLSIVFVCGLLLWPPTLIGLIAGLLAIVASVALNLYSIVAAVTTARRIGVVRMTRLNHAWIYLVIIIVVRGGAGQLVPTDHSAWGMYGIPSSAMMPSARPGDFISASRGYYQSHRPETGDVVVFKLPRDNRTDYVKRIVGLPGDRIQFINGRLVINGAEVARERIDDFTYQGGGVTRTGTQYIETLPNGRKYIILKLADRSALDDTSIFVVPPRHYFVVGDNRDNSSDSRDPHGGVGYVPEENLRDRMSFIYWSSDWHRIGTPVE
jgi:signal peptidase I